MYRLLSVYVCIFHICVYHGNRRLISRDVYITRDSLDVLFIRPNGHSLTPDDYNQRPFSETSLANRVSRSSCFTLCSNNANRHATAITTPFVSTYCRCLTNKNKGTKLYSYNTTIIQYKARSNFVCIQRFS